MTGELSPGPVARASPGPPSRPPSWTRHPADLARLLASLAGLAVVVGWTYAEPDAATGISRSLVQAVGWLPAPVRAAAGGLAQLVALATPLVVLAVVLVRRWVRLTAVLVVTGVAAAAGAAALQGWLDDTAPREVIRRLGTESWVTGTAFPSPAYVAALAAVTTVLAPSFPVRWRRVAWWAVAVVAVLRLATAAAVPLHVAGTLLLGLTVGSLTLLVAGAPARRGRLADALAAADAGGHGLERLEPDASDGWHRARASDGTPVTVRVADRDERDADLLFRIVTAVQRRGLGGDHPGWTPERTVQHEALATLLAGRAGVAVPDVVGVGAVEDGTAVLVTGDRAGTPLASLDAGDLDDEALRRVWRQVTVMHDARIAHRELGAAFVRLTVPDGADGAGGAGPGPGGVVVTDFARAVLGADDTLLAADVAELLVSLALRVGPQRAAAGAVAGLGADRLAAALPLLQPLALSAATRRDLHAHGRAGKALLDDLRVEVQRAAGVEAYELAELARLSVGRIVGLVGGVVLVSVLISFASNWSEIADAVADADLTRLPVVLVMAALTYVAGALSLLGAVPHPLPLVQTSEVMLAQSFLNRFTPANTGGMALRARYLQRNGLELSMAATSVGLTSAASGIVQALFIVVFLAWSGQGDDEGLNVSLPDVNVLALVLCTVAVVGGLVWLTPLRRLLGSRLALSARRVLGEVRGLAADPGKMALLLGGAALGKLATIVAFEQSARAFGVDLGFAQLGAIYLTANTVASAAPTPGGLGAVEAALMAVLTGAQVDAAVALSTVLLFRLVTFWLPVAPAWLALRHLRRTDAV